MSTACYGLFLRREREDGYTSVCVHGRDVIYTMLGPRYKDREQFIPPSGPQLLESRQELSDLTHTCLQRSQQHKDLTYPQHGTVSIRRRNEAVHVPGIGKDDEGLGNRNEAQAIG